MKPSLLCLVAALSLHASASEIAPLQVQVVAESTALTTDPSPTTFDTAITKAVPLEAYGSDGSMTGVSQATVGHHYTCLRIEEGKAVLQGDNGGTFKIQVDAINVPAGFLPAAAPAPVPVSQPPPVTSSPPPAELAPTPSSLRVDQAVVLYSWTIAKVIPGKYDFDEVRFNDDKTFTSWSNGTLAEKGEWRLISEGQIEVRWDRDIFLFTLDPAKNQYTAVNSRTGEKFMGVRKDLAVSVAEFAAAQRPQPLTAQGRAQLQDQINSIEVHIDFMKREEAKVIRKADGGVIVKADGRDATQGAYRQMIIDEEEQVAELERKLHSRPPDPNAPTESPYAANPSPPLNNVAPATSGAPTGPVAGQSSASLEQVAESYTWSWSNIPSSTGNYDEVHFNPDKTWTAWTRGKLRTTGRWEVAGPSEIKIPSKQGYILLTFNATLTEFDGTHSWKTLLVRGARKDAVGSNNPNPN